MRSESREIRRREIIEHAFAMLAQDGYAAFSMQALAKVSRSSKETLYGWFGGKAGLYEAMVAENAAKLVLPSAEADDGVSELSRFGADLLSVLLGERAMLLNRVAAAEAGVETALGKFLAAKGRGHVMPKLAVYFQALEQRGAIGVPVSAEPAEVWLSLLVGDLQIRRATGAIDLPAEAEMIARSARAATLTFRLYGVNEKTRR
ncbi:MULTISPECIES: TetR/AcrR family transcriptional regulator [Agrobacterium]|uniref:Helix-turn-helix transcriptional regulator n=1 Tax=Agrobacterium tumefaciens TaxID=358 RepID=A0AAE6BBQ3_AGRTU|nr:MULTISPECIES: TetR/AcrR family transcriptional regulator C-terminal domain-containing protein [Agrobacterium]QCL73461.1 helix-turn-helix transcriptional regulator [Agrobacterium tumefaciens]QCL79033.1 helix-turn-helix transcriptional regulator [Agrobacterium tumefaciens]CUX41733.1 TetR family transcriptional regulator [Agrobacterium sp. NCPPB 925]